MNKVIRITLLLFFNFSIFTSIVCQINFEQTVVNYIIAKKDTFNTKNTKLYISDNVSDSDTELSFFPNLNLNKAENIKATYDLTLKIPKKYRFQKTDTSHFVWQIDKAVKCNNSFYVLARYEKIINPNGGRLLLFKISDEGKIIQYYKSNWVR